MDGLIEPVVTDQALRPAWCPILVGVDVGDGVAGPLALATALARERGSRLYVVSVVPPLPVTVAMAPWPAEDLMADRLEEVDGVRAAAARAVPADVLVEFRCVRGRTARALSLLVEDEMFGTVVVPGAWTASVGVRRAARRWRERGIDVHAAW